METITIAQWDQLTRHGYTLVSGDQCYILRLIAGKGTCLVPVWVTK